jgi:renalase
MNAVPHYAVIGAGIAGLSCASVLRRAGFDVTVFEKSRGPGGRMSTRRGDDWACDHGAQYFTARDPVFHAEVERWQRQGAVALWQPRLKVFEGGQIRDTAGAVARYVGTPGMTGPARLLAQGLDLQTQVTVTGLKRRADGWQIDTAERGMVDTCFDAVVLAVPAPQAAPLLASVSPVLAAGASGELMRACWALMLRFDAPLALPFDAAFVNEGALSWVARNNSKPGRSGGETWSLHASADWSEAHLELEPEAAAAVLIDAFISLGGRAPQAWSAHRWRYAITSATVEGGFAWHAADGLGVCGDWLNGGRVEGAWLSGRRLAESMLRSFTASAY